MRNLIAAAMAVVLTGLPQVHAQDAPQARQYLESLRATLDTLKAELPAISLEADRVAEAILAGESMAMSDPALASELSHGAGTMLNYNVGSQGIEPNLTKSDDPAARAALAWTFQCELFAAMTRRGKVPVVRKSLEIDTRRTRLLRYAGQTFHHDRWLDPIEPQVLGMAYLDGLDAVLLDIGTASWDSLVRTTEEAEDTLAVGGCVFLRVGGRYVPHLTADCSPLTLLSHDGDDPALAAPESGDMVIAIGDTAHAGSEWWGDIYMLREADHIAWVVQGYNTKRHDLDRGEWVVDLMSPVEDCVVKVEHYDARLGATSGVAAAAVYQMILLELRGDVISIPSP